MNIWLKILLWFSASVAVLILLSFVFGFFMMYQSTRYLTDAEEFSITADKDACLVEASRIVAEGFGPMAMMQGIGFGGTCLENATGKRRTYCSGNQPATTLPRDYCAPYQDSSYCAPTVIGILTAYCSGDFAE